MPRSSVLIKKLRAYAPINAYNFISTFSNTHARHSIRQFYVTMWHINLFYLPTQICCILDMRASLYEQHNWKLGSKLFDMNFIWLISSHTKIDIWNTTSHEDMHYIQYNNQSTNYYDRQFHPLDLISCPWPCHRSSTEIHLSLTRIPFSEPFVTSFVRLPDRQLLVLRHYHLL